MGTDRPHQALGNDALDERGHEIAGNAGVDEPRDGRGGVVGMQSREDQVAGHGGPHGDFGGLQVPDFPDQDDVRILAQNGPQRAGERQAGVRVDLSLVDAFDIALDRILDGEEVGRRRSDRIDDRVQGRGFAAPRRARHQDDALVPVGERFDRLIRLLGHSQRVQLGQRFRLVRDAEDHLFAVQRRQGGDPEVHGALFNLHADGAVLRNAALGDIHQAENLEA